MPTAKPAVDRLEIVHLPVDQLRPNPWNPNRVAPAMMHKLREYMRREGIVQFMDSRGRRLALDRAALAEIAGFSESPREVVEA